MRHLLTGCATCAAFTAPIFRFAEAPLVRPRDSPQEPLARAEVMTTPPPTPAFRQLHVALILLRLRARKNQGAVAGASGVSLSAVRGAEAGGARLETVDRLLTYYGADLALCHKLLRVARRHLGDLSQIRGPKMITRRQAEEIWAQVERPPKPRPDTSWTRSGRPST